MEKQIKDLSYNQAVEELEDIIAQLSDQNVDVDKLAEHVKRATALVELCKTKLTRAETQVNKLLEK
ncbi:MAG: exodeoxyribonuclease VII small subunit [Rikenellaceae bacterium]